MWLFSALAIINLSSAIGSPMPARWRQAAPYIGLQGPTGPQPGRIGSEPSMSPLCYADILLEVA